MKIYAKQISPEWTDNEPYFSDFIECNKELIIDGGREFKDYNDEILSKIKYTIDNYYVFENSYGYHNLSEYLSDYAPKKVNGKRYSTSELKKIKEAFDENRLSQTAYEENIIILMLTIVYGKKYDECYLKGCSQGDCVKLYYPVGTNKETIDYLEILYWNLGTELIVHDGENEANNVDEIDGYSIYITDYDVKRGLAKEFNCNEDDIILYEFDHYIHVPQYKRV